MKSFLALSILLVTAMAFAAVDEPEFDFPYSDGLYATVSLPKTIGKSYFERGESIELLGIPGFRRELEVHSSKRSLALVERDVRLGDHGL